VERAMGIENTALKTQSAWNQGVMNSPARLVRLSCEKPRHSGQREPIAANMSSPLRVWALL
jgi:hypothetical protein